MARSDLLVSLVKAGASGDRSTLTTTVEALVADERAKSHYILADKLHRALASVPVTVSSELWRTDAPGRDFVIESEPRVALDSLILTLPAERLTRQLVEEQHRADLLRAQGMQRDTGCCCRVPPETARLRSLRPWPRRSRCHYSRCATMRL